MRVETITLNEKRNVTLTAYIQETGGEFRYVTKHPAVDKDTCPCFLFATRTDNVVPIMNSIGFMEALAKADISFESHIYSYGPHGFSTCDPSIQPKDTQMSERIPHWVEDSIGWLKEVFGEFGAEGLTEPAYKAHVTDDCEAFLSVDCTMARIMGNPEGARIAGAVFEEIKKKTGADQMGDTMQSFIQKMKLRDVLGYGEAPEEYIYSLNEQLSKIPNI